MPTINIKLVIIEIGYSDSKITHFMLYLYSCSLWLDPCLLWFL